MPDHDPAARAASPAERPLNPLGPPGWSEFAAARRRFETTLAIEGLERALARPARRGDAPPPAEGR